MAGTLVQTEGGLMPIEQVREGDRVLTHTRQWQEVAATGVKPFTGAATTSAARPNTRSMSGGCAAWVTTGTARSTSPNGLPPAS